MNRRRRDRGGPDAGAPAPDELAALTRDEPANVAHLVADTGWGRDHAHGVRVLVFRAGAQIVVVEVRARVHWMALDGVIRPCPWERAHVRTRRGSRPPARVDAAGRFTIASVPAGPLSLVVEAGSGSETILMTEWVTVSRQAPPPP